MKPIEERKPSEWLTDKQTGISIRWVQSFDAEKGQEITDEDVRRWQELAAWHLRRLGLM
jgi:hypothetical protein